MAKSTLGATRAHLILHLPVDGWTHAFELMGMEPPFPRWSTQGSAVHGMKMVVEAGYAAKEIDALGSKYKPTPEGIEWASKVVAEYERVSNIKAMSAGADDYPFGRRYSCLLIWINNAGSVTPGDIVGMASHFPTFQSRASAEMALERLQKHALVSVDDAGTWRTTDEGLRWAHASGGKMKDAKKKPRRAGRPRRDGKKTETVMHQMHMKGHSADAENALRMAWR